MAAIGKMTGKLRVRRGGDVHHDNVTSKIVLLSVQQTGKKKIFSGPKSWEDHDEDHDPDDSTKLVTAFGHRAKLDSYIRYL
ncbi:uncharacterized protein PHALS_09335 [Plasmopara halstedii]|uniref:Uncharacterized protein n=1 Tax=Plasmopara halstedii TaxID=4781 RepID=A0A0P1AFA3_PLAHL|nr:uncharacterized protein PHALS_09335 [Plasmopara halstedii]CEG39285.1 hypothetical protein PHALS_09335 [Plasmopara halstedii]|eukprot:XP_024575654.1 hypothetical protein PHALS_09335 [Plasmopara halstedii]